MPNRQYSNSHGTCHWKHSTKISLLSVTQPVSSNENVTTLDKIVHVACCLINVCDSVVPFD